MFEKTICDCCACPIQRVCEQLIGEEGVSIRSDGGGFDIIIQEAKNFIVSGPSTDMFNPGILHISSSTINSVTFPSSIEIDLKPIQNNSKGECICLENPMTNLANSLLNKEFVSIQGIILELEEVVICKVGKGVMIVKEKDDNENFIAVSTCKVSTITELPPDS
ncbi:hypothetical protein [Chengkuizengella sediminis]|uniref:hypothetical protein n=1 Tax=Chengkuizengella sediminis TaxID=1885917 RepID=UPI001389B0AD|nr:hypothetical protein [Chengkuizengella sediminis]NDI33225.1 hypothetical protein [Chengkuizengella sediminis]